MIEKASDIAPITDDALHQAVSAAQARVGDEQERLKRTEERLLVAERELGLLIELARLRGLTGIPGGNGADTDARSDALHRPRNVVRPLMRRSARDALVQTVIDILREHGKPMPIRTLMAEVVSCGAPIPGRGEQANLISVITRVPEIVRPRRGFYGLREGESRSATEPPTLPASRHRKATR